MAAEYDSAGQAWLRADRDGYAGRRRNAGRVRMGAGTPPGAAGNVDPRRVRGGRRAGAVDETRGVGGGRRRDGDFAGARVPEHAGGSGRRVSEGICVTLDR